VPQEGARADRGAPDVQPSVIPGGAEAAERDPATVAQDNLFMTLDLAAGRAAHR